MCSVSDRMCTGCASCVAAVSADAVVHGDLRWDNCMLVAAPGARRRTRVLLVDWELGGVGPAAFDIGTALAEYLIAWVASIPMPDPHDPSRFAEQAGHPLARMRPAVHALWRTYRSARTQPPALAQVVDLAAVRLLQTAMERARQADELSAHAVVHRPGRRPSAPRSRGHGARAAGIARVTPYRDQIAAAVQALTIRGASAIHVARPRKPAPGRRARGRDGRQLRARPIS